MLRGTPDVEPMEGLVPEPSDYVSVRRSGLGMWYGTDLDATLRDLGVATVVLSGVSTNLALFAGAGFEAVARALERQVAGRVRPDWLPAAALGGLCMLAPLALTVFGSVTVWRCCTTTAVRRGVKRRVDEPS